MKSTLPPLRNADRSLKEQGLLTRDSAISIRGTNNAPALMVVDEAQGVMLRDLSGKSYIDLYGNNVHHIGYRHPRLIAALKDQLDRATLSARGLTNAVSVEFAETLAALWGDATARVATVPSGSDAMETALAVAKAATGRYRTISFYTAYHGRSAGALSVSGRRDDRAHAGPLLPGALHVPPFHPFEGGPHLPSSEDYASYSLDALRTIFTHEGDIAALVAEPIRNRAYVPPDWYWPEARALCDRHGALLIFDEIPAGLGKIGRLFNHEHVGARPDITLVGKALGGTAVPVAAVIVDGQLSIPSEANVGYFTHEKNILSACAALTTLSIIRDEGMTAATAAHAARIADGLQRIRADSDKVCAVRTAGFMTALEFGCAGRAPGEAANLAAEAYRTCVLEGVVPAPVAGSCMSLSFPLIISDDEIDSALAIVARAVGA